MMNILKVETCSNHMHVLIKMMLIYLDLCGEGKARFKSTI